MKVRWKKLAAGVLAFGLMLGSLGCDGQTVAAPNVVNIPVDKVRSLLLPPTITFLRAGGASESMAGDPVSPHLLELDNLVVAPEYPEMPKLPQREDYPDNFNKYQKALTEWRSNRTQYSTPVPENVHDLDPFLKAAMEQFLSGEGNSVCSPLNIYFALAMLAESASGDSRQQILDALGHGSIESLRRQANALWLDNYCNDGLTVSLTANSLWLNSQYRFRQETLSTLGEHYFASVFSGDLGTAELNTQLAQWISSQTGGLLNQNTQSFQLDPEAAFTLISATYFRGGWADFSPKRTGQKVFHAEKKELLTDFMDQSMEEKTYYWGDDFSAIRLSTDGNQGMWLFLPNEGQTPQSLLKQKDYYELIRNPGGWEQKRTLTVNLSMPKFDVKGQQSLVSGLNAMGITDVFDPGQANFSSVSQDPMNVSDIQHAARVAVDEEGVVAAAYTVALAEAQCLTTGDAPEIDFILDRTFLFVMTGPDLLPLFAGVVANP